MKYHNILNSFRFVLKTITYGAIGVIQLGYQNTQMILIVKDVLLANLLQPNLHQLALGPLHKELLVRSTN